MPVCKSFFTFALVFIHVSLCLGGVSAEESLSEVPISRFDRDHWSYNPLSQPTTPTVEDVDWTQSRIDRFILKEIESRSLRPAPPADRNTLLRRLCWDLTGLPPTIEQIQQFTSDDSVDAYERQVDRLLASPEYGKRWGQFWLDLARYADTDGFEHDKIRPQSWRYRDWVINALNQDLPYDEFVRLQIAGDQLRSDASNAALATAFCLSGPDMPDINSMDERRHVLLNEITSTIGAVLLGLQFGCAQCHDHKYDAISQADFYRLRAFFDSSIKLTKNVSVSVLASHQDSPRTHLMIRGDWRRKGPALDPAYPRVISNSQSPQIDMANARVQLAHWLTDRSNPLTARVFVNRIWQYHFGMGLSSTPSDFGIMGEEPSHPELLDYLAGDFMQHGWSLKRLHRQIVTSSVYQTCGSRPDEPNAAHWWKQSIKIDPENRLLTRFPRRRLNAESIRDGLLAVGDAINLESGGPGVSPPLPSEMVKTLKAGQWKVSPSPADHNRRSIYLFARRNLRYPFFATFDRPTADQPCARRNQSTTAIQSLTLFNSDFVISASRQLAWTIQSDHREQRHQINDLYLRLYTRLPNQSETDACIEFLAGDAEIADLCRAMMNSNEFLYVD